MKKVFFAGFLFVVIIVAGTVFVPNTLAEKQSEEDRSVTIEGATPERPVVYLGKSFDRKSGKEVEGYAIVHYAKGSRSNTGFTFASASAVCYGFLAEGAKWKIAEDWIVDSVYTGGIDAKIELGILAQSIGKWENASGADILGIGVSKAVSNPKTLGKTINNKNEVTFAPIRNRGTIAVTYVWGIFSGSISGRYLAEWDQVYNTRYSWSASNSGEAGKMDFENIATHELGHSMGMDDLYNSECNQETMFGYADYGETNKRDLNIGDVTGISLLY